MRKEEKQVRYFSLVGAQRSGTTFLYKMLNQHPEIQMNWSLRPEPKFFIKADFKNYSYETYLQKVFKSSPNPAIIYGEKSTSYLEHSEVAQRIKSFIPSAKILVLLRNPVDRAISNYSFSYANQLENREASVALEQSNEKQLEVPTGLSVNPYLYVSRGIYENYLEAYQRVFGKRLKVILFEELVKDFTCIQDIYKFLGASQDFTPKNFTLPANTSPNMQISQETRKRLVEFYKPHNRSLEKMLNISLKVWE